jgi:hypothetical protein
MVEPFNQFRGTEARIKPNKKACQNFFGEKAEIPFRGLKVVFCG